MYDARRPTLYNLRSDVAVSGGKGSGMSTPRELRDQAKKAEVIAFLHSEVFDPILNSAQASETLKRGVRYTIMRIDERDATGIAHYYWSAIIGTVRSTEFARQMRVEGFTRLEEVIDEFRDRFGDVWLSS